MTLEQLELLVKLLRGNMSSLAVKSAKLVLVDGLSQVEAARMLNTNPNTVNNGVKRYKDVNEEIIKFYSFKNNT